MALAVAMTGRDRHDAGASAADRPTAVVATVSVSRPVAADADHQRGDPRQRGAGRAAAPCLHRETTRPAAPPAAAPTRPRPASP